MEPIVLFQWLKRFFEKRFPGWFHSGGLGFIIQIPKV